MNRTLAICTIALVAGIMMIGSFAPMAVADKGGVPNENSEKDKPAKITCDHKGKTISVSEKARAAHERHGDTCSP